MYEVGCISYGPSLLLAGVVLKVDRNQMVLEMRRTGKHAGDDPLERNAYPVQFGRRQAPDTWVVLVVFECGWEMVYIREGGMAAVMERSGRSVEVEV